MDGESSNSIEKTAMEEIMKEAKVMIQQSMPTQITGTINKRLFSSKLASTLRNPIIPKIIKSRTVMGLNDTEYEQIPTKKNKSKGYESDEEYIYDARKYFNPEKQKECEIYRLKRQQYLLAKEVGMSITAPTVNPYMPVSAAQNPADMGNYQSGPYFPGEDSSLRMGETRTWKADSEKYIQPGFDAMKYKVTNMATGVYPNNPLVSYEPPINPILDPTYSKGIIDARSASWDSKKKKKRSKKKHSRSSDSDSDVHRKKHKRRKKKKSKKRESLTPDAADTPVVKKAKKTCSDEGELDDTDSQEEQTNKAANIKHSGASNRDLFYGGSSDKDRRNKFFNGSKEYYSTSVGSVIKLEDNDDDYLDFKRNTRVKDEMVDIFASGEGF